jgi:hypothetical protein
MLNTQRILAAGLTAVLGVLVAGGAAQAADFGDSTYGLQVPYIEGDMGDVQVEPAGHRTRIAQPQFYDPSVDYQQGYAQYPDREPLPPRPNGQCLASNQIERMLAAQGWRSFVNPKRGVDVVGLTASRPNGLTYRLKLDRCTGVILQANLLDQPDTRRRSYSYDPNVPVPGY